MSKVKAFHAIVNEQTYVAEIEEEIIKTQDSVAKGSLQSTGLQSYSLLLDGSSYDLHIHTKKSGSYIITINGTAIEVILKNQRELLLQQFGMNNPQDSLEKEIRAPMPGLVLNVLVSEGQEVEKGTGLLILEAMKMENEIKAPAKGVVKRVHVKPGSAIVKNDLLVEL